MPDTESEPRHIVVPVVCIVLGGFEGINNPLGEMVGLGTFGHGGFLLGTHKVLRVSQGNNSKRKRYEKQRT